MTESVRLINLFKKLYNGSPWIDVNIVATLSNITTEQAQKKLLPKANTIWEITNHLISWRINVLQRLHGQMITSPENNYFEEVKDTSANAWETTLSKFENTQEQWLEFLTQFKVEDFETPYPGNEMTYYEHVQGIIQHDAYHLGQIVLLSKNS